MASEIAQLIVALCAVSSSDRIAAAEQLSLMGPDAAAAAVPLVEACADASEEVREYATAALEEMGPPPANTLQRLTELVGHENADVGYWAATLLGRAGEGGGEGAAAAVPVLATAVSDSPHAAVQHRAAWALGQIGPSASAALDTLRKAAAGDDPRLARLAQRAIDRL